MQFYGIQLTFNLWYGQNYFCFTSSCVGEVKWESIPSHTHKIWSIPMDWVVLGQVHTELSRFWDSPAAEFLLWGSWRFPCNVGDCVGRIGWIPSLEAAVVWSRFSCALGCWEDQTAGDCCTFLVAGCREPCQTRGRGDCSEGRHSGICITQGSAMGGDSGTGGEPAPWGSVTQTMDWEHRQKHPIKQSTREWWQQRQCFNSQEETQLPQNLLALVCGKVMSWPRFFHSTSFLGTSLVFQA